ncbi:MAG: hypothetical protein AB7T38_11220 [Nitrospirales bacterium]
MFLNDENWCQVKEFNQQFERIKNKIRTGGDRDLLIRNSTSQRLIAIAARRRSLSFYKSYELIEIQLDLEKLNLERDYQRAHLYFLVSDTDAILLNGKSQIIHEINSYGQREEGNVGELDLETRDNCKDYLRFFCSFVMGKDGPFTIVETPDDLLWPNQSKENLIVGFSTIVENRRDQYGWPAAPINLSFEDLKRFAESNSKPEKLFGGKVDFKRHFSDASTALEETKKCVKPVEVHPHIKERGHYTAEGIVLYDEMLFKAKFEIKPDGLIEMITDEVIHSVPLPVWNLHWAAPIMILPNPRRIVNSDLILNSIKEKDESPEDQNNSSSISDSPKVLRIDGDLDLSSKSFSKYLSLQNLEILGDLILNNSKFNGGIDLTGAKILGRLLANKIECEYSFRAEGLYVYGLFKQDPLGKNPRIQTETSVRFHGGVFKSNFEMPRATIFGGLDMRDIKIFGSADLPALEIGPITPLSAEPRCMFDGGRFHRGLSLETWIPPKFSAPMDKAKNSLIVGSFNAEQMAITAGDLNFSGLSIKPHEKGLKIEHGDLTEARMLGIELALKERIVNLVFNPNSSKLEILGAFNEEDLFYNQEIHRTLLNLNGTKIEGRFLGSGMTVQGDIEANQINIGVQANLCHISVGKKILRMAKNDANIIETGSFYLMASRLSRLTLGRRFSNFTEIELFHKILDLPVPSKSSCIFGSLRLDRACISDSIDAPYLKIHENLDLESAKVERDVILSVRESDGPAVIGGDLILNNCQLRGDFIAAGMVVGRSVVANRAELQSLDLGFINFVIPDPAEAEISIQKRPRESVIQTQQEGLPREITYRTHISGNLFLRNLVCNDGCSFRGILVGGVVSAPGARFSKSCDFGSVDPQKLQTIINAEQKPSEFLVALDLSGTKNGWVNLGGAYIKGKVSFVGAEIDGILHGNSTNCFRTHITHDLELSGVRACSDLRFKAARIDGHLLVITGSFQRFYFSPDWIKQDERIHHQDYPRRNSFIPVEIGGILIVHASLKLIDLWGIQVHPSSHHDYGSGSIEITNVHIESDLLLGKDSIDYLHYGISKEDPREKEFPRLEDFPSKISEGIKIDACNIGGDLNLSHQQCNKIHLDHTRIHGDLIAGKTEMNLGINTDSLEIHRCQFDGEVQINIIQLQRLVCVKTIYGRSLLLNLINQFNHPLEVLLDRSQINLLSYTNKNEKDRTLIRSKNSEIKEVEFLGALPQQIALYNSRITRWIFGYTPHKTKMGIQLSSLRKILAESLPFDRENYLRISNALREIGKSFESNVIYVDMRWRAITDSSSDNYAEDYWRPKGIKRWLNCWRLSFIETLLGIFTGFWTKGYKTLIWSGSFTLILSLWIIQTPENIAPTTMQMGENGAKANLERKSFPNPIEWSEAEKFRILLDNHIPIITVVTQPRWELAENRLLTLKIPSFLLNNKGKKFNCSGGSNCTPDNENPTEATNNEKQSNTISLSLLSPAGYGLFVRLLHWIGWSLALVGIAATIQRRRETE